MKKKNPAICDSCSTIVKAAVRFRQTPRDKGWKQGRELILFQSILLNSHEITCDKK